MAYIGVSPSNGVRQKHTYTATASQTSFSGAGAEGISLSYLDSNYVDVYQNGVKLSEADYTSTTGTTVVLATGATVSDMIEIIVYDVFSVADTVSKADGGTFDGNVAMAGTLGVTGAVTANAGVVVDEMTLDGDTLTATDDFVLDVTDDITLDAGGGQIRFFDDGTEIGVFSNVSSDFLIVSAVQDKDILFNGNDGGAAITALTLDMSDAGTAIFNHDIKLADNSKAFFGASSDLEIFHDGTDSFIQDEGTGNLKIRTNGSAIELKTTADEAMVVATKDGAVDLYHNNSKKFETTSSGVTVTGDILTTNIYGANDGNTGIQFEGSDVLTFHTGGAENIQLTSNSIVFNQDSADMDFRVEGNGDAALFFCDAGTDKVCIGTTSPDGFFKIEKNYQSDVAMTFNDTSGSGGTAVRFKVNGSTKGEISFNTSNTTYATSSDYRLKENLEYNWDATTRLKQLKPARFNWIVDDTNTSQDGFLAHEVSSIVPEAVVGTKDKTQDIGTITDENGDVRQKNVPEVAKENSEHTWTKTGTENVYQGIDQSKIVPLLVKSLQEALTEIDTLKTKVAALENA